MLIENYYLFFAQCGINNNKKIINHPDVKTNITTPRNINKTVEATDPLAVGYIKIE